MTNVDVKEYKRIATKGRGWLKIYLDSVTEGALSSDTRSHVINVIKDSYNEYMEKDDEFYDMVSSFVCERRTSKEKEKFYSGILSFLIREGNIREAYAKKYPEDCRTFSKQNDT